MRAHLLWLFSIAVGHLLGGSALLAASPEFCALSVKIRFWDGNPINLTTIELVDPSGMTVLRQTVGSEFQICDFKFGPHTLRVGVNECLPIAVSNLEVKLGNPILLDLRLPKCAYGRPHFGSSSGARACSAYFRTVAEKDEPLAAVEIHSGLGSAMARTDSYGRWQGILAGTEEFTFRKPGYEPKALRVGCPDAGPLEISVPLTPKR